MSLNIQCSEINFVFLTKCSFQPRMVEIIDASKSRSLSLVDAYALQQFLFEVNVQLSWIEDHLAQVENSEYGTDLTATQRLLNRHEVRDFLS